MAKQHIVTALDIGSGSIKLISVCKKEDEGFEILAHHEEPSLGIRKGVVINVAQVSKAISSLVSKAEQDCGTRIDRVYANIGGGHISSVSSRGLVSVSRADRKISEEDVDRVLQAARISYPFSSNNIDIIEVFPKEFIVDGEGGIKDAVGMEGLRLEVETLLLCGFKPYIKNSSQTILASKLQINELIPDPLASARSILTPREKELGVCILDIGAGTTSMAVYEEGSLIHAAVFSIGSGHITNDIAICLKTDIDTAEKIKLEYGVCKEDGKKQGKKSEIRLEGEDSLVFSKNLLIDIIDARVSEILNLAGKELKKISKQGMLPAGIVLTGGGAKLPGIRNLAKKELKLPCRIGKPTEISGFQAEPNLATLCGLVLEGFDAEKTFSSKRTKFVGRLKNIFRTFVP